MANKLFAENPILSYVELTRSNRHLMFGTQPATAVAAAACPFLGRKLKTVL